MEALSSFSDSWHACHGAQWPRVFRIEPQALVQLLQELLAWDAGAIVGLAALGPQAVRMQLLPNLEPYVELLEGLMGAGPGAQPQHDEIRRLEAARCYGALLAAAAGAMYDRITQR